MNIDTSTILWAIGGAIAVIFYFLRDKDQQLKEVSQRVSYVHDTQIRHDERLSKHDDNFENIDLRLDKIEQKVDDRFDKLDDKLDIIANK